MKKLLIIICLEMFMLSCSPAYKCNSNHKMEQTVQVRQVHNFVEIPTDLLENLDKMGVDSSSILNEYEGRYFNFIFKIDEQDFNLVGKKVAFSKIGFFKDEKEWFYRGEGVGVGGTILYIFNDAQKEESGGYDAAIRYWSKFVIPIEEVVKRLKEKD